MLGGCLEGFWGMFGGMLEGCLGGFLGDVQGELGLKKQRFRNVREACRSDLHKCSCKIGLDGPEL